MTELREKLGDICDAEIQSDNPSCYALADAILAALPDMVPELNDLSDAKAQQQRVALIIKKWKDAEEQAYDLRKRIAELEAELAIGKACEKIAEDTLESLREPTQ